MAAAKAGVKLGVKEAVETEGAKEVVEKAEAVTVEGVMEGVVMEGAVMEEEEMVEGMGLEMEEEAHVAGMEERGKANLKEEVVKVVEVKAVEAMVVVRVAGWGLAAEEEGMAEVVM